MNGPLLISLLPPERIWEPALANSFNAAIVAIVLLAGLLLSLFLRRPEH